MKQSEAAKCRDNGVAYTAFLVANDGISLVTSRQNTWANCLTTVDELKKIWQPGSKVDNWRDVRASFPSVPLKLFGAGTDSGTFEFFTERINGKAKASRSDYVASEDDNVLVRGVTGERGSLGYFGYSYYVENKSRLKLLARQQRQRLRAAEPGAHPGVLVQAALAPALRLREALVVRAQGRAGLHPLHDLGEKQIAQRAKWCR